MSALTCSDGGGAGDIGASTVVRVSVASASGLLIVTAVNVTDGATGYPESIRLWALGECSVLTGPAPSCVAGSVQPVFLGGDEYGWQLRLPGFGPGTVDVVVEHPVMASPVRFALVAAHLPAPSAGTGSLSATPSPAVAAAAAGGCPDAAFTVVAALSGANSTTAAPATSLVPPGGRAPPLVNMLACADGGGLLQASNQMAVTVMLPGNSSTGGALSVSLSARSRTGRPDLAVFIGVGCFAPPLERCI